MRVGVDATAWSDRRGYGRFARNAVTKLVELDQDTTWVLYAGPGPNMTPLPGGAEVRTLSGSGLPGAASSRPVGELARAGWAVSRDRLDAFLFPSVGSYFPVVGVPTIVGVHDVIADDLPTLTLPTRRSRALWRLKENVAVRRASRLFTVSAVSRTAIATRFGVSASQLEVVPEAPDPVFHPRDGDEVARELHPVRVEPGQFFLYSGGISPHKNIERLLDAYAALVRERPSAPPLVVVGDLDDTSYLSSGRALRGRIADLEIGDRVVLPGFVSDEALACLYSAATAVVIPSLAEGFGLPAVEAAACGAAVVLSDLPAHRETLDGAALFFPPRDTAALREALATVLEDQETRRALGRQSRAAVSGLSWEITAERLRRLVASAAGAR